MKHNKWMKALCCGLAVMLLTCLLAVGGAAEEFSEADFTLSDYVLSNSHTQLVLDSSEKIKTPAYAEVELTFHVSGEINEVKRVQLNSSSFSINGSIVEDSTKKKDNYYLLVDGTLTVHLKKLSYLGGSTMLTLNISTNKGLSTVNVPLNQFTSVIESTTGTPSKDASQPYLSGYTLTQPNGLEIPGELTEGQRCNVVLRITDPALTDQSIDADRICTKLNCPSFTFTGLGEVSHYDNASGSFIAIFRDAIYNGRSSDIKVDLWYTDSDLPLRTISASFGALNSDPASDIKHTSNIIVRDVDYGREVIAGQPFTLNLTLFSSIGDENINDIIVRLVLPEDVSVVNGSESGYIASMAPRSTASVSFVLQPKVNIEKTTVSIGVDISGTGAVSYSAVSASPNISIPVTQPIRFEFTSLEAPSDLMVGVEDVVSATYVNKGKNTLSNVTATLTGTNLMNGEQSQYLGNVESGSEKSVEFNISAAEAGTVNGLLTLTYEDSNGQEQSISRPFSSTVEEMPVYEDFGMDIPMEEPTPAGPPIWLYLLLGLLVILGGFLGFKAWKRHAAKKAAAKAEEDEDDGAEEPFQYRPLPSANEGSTHEVH